MLTFQIRTDRSNLTITSRDTNELLATIACAPLDADDENETDRINALLKTSGFESNDSWASDALPDGEHVLTGQATPIADGGAVIHSIGDDATFMRIDRLTSGIFLLTVAAGEHEESFFADCSDAEAALDEAHRSLDGTTPNGECFFTPADAAHTP